MARSGRMEGGKIARRLAAERTFGPMMSN